MAPEANVKLMPRGGEESIADALERTLKSEISSGKRPVGSLLPTETELCQQTGLSRYTVRKIVGRLTEQGLVSRQQGIGTTVMAAQAQSRYVQTMGSIEDLFQYASGTEFKVEKRGIVRAADAECDLLQCPLGTKWLRVSGVRYGKSQDSAQKPIAQVMIYVAARYGEPHGLGKSPKTPVYSLIEASYGVRFTRVEQEIHGRVIAGDAAVTLAVPDGSAGLLIVRRYYIGEELVEVTTGLHPAERFIYSMAFQLANR